MHAVVVFMNLFLSGVEQASTACGWASGEEACVADGREGYCSVAINTFTSLLNFNSGVPVH